MTWHGLDRQFRLKNKSTINLNYLDNDADMYRYQGREMPIIIVDELTQFPQSWIEYLKTRNRTSNPDWPVRFRAGSNPGGVGHGWVKNTFIDNQIPEQLYVDPSTDISRIYIPAKVDDHPLENFRTQYKRKLNALADQDLKRALLHGDWDVFAGQVFTEWRYDRHTIEPFSIPTHWRRWRSMDYGFNTYSAILWYAQDPQEDRTYVYRELYISQSPVSGTSLQIKQLESGEKMMYGMADPSIWKGAGDHNTGETVASMFEKEGINWQPANNDRLAGKGLIHEMLADAPDGKPKLMVFQNCTNLIRTLPSLPYDKNRVEDVDTKAEDHLYDSLRYGLMNLRYASVPQEASYKPDNMLRRKYS